MDALPLQTLQTDEPPRRTTREDELPHRARLVEELSIRLDERRTLGRPIRGPLSIDQAPTMRSTRLRARRSIPAWRRARRRTRTTRLRRAGSPRRSRPGTRVRARRSVARVVMAAVRTAKEQREVEAAGLRRTGERERAGAGLRRTDREEARVATRVLRPRQRSLHLPRPRTAGLRAGMRTSGVRDPRALQLRLLP